MRQRNIMRVFCVLFGIIAVVALLLQLFLKPAQPVDITRNFEYTGTSDTQLPDAPDTIEEDGQTYTRVDYAEIQPDVNVISAEEHVTETVTLNDLPSEQAPETKEFEVKGQTVTLPLVSADYTPVTRTYQATGDVRYDNQTSEPNPPETSEVTYKNAEGNDVTVEGTLQSVERVDDGTATRTVTSTVELPAGATIFVVNGKYVTYNPDTPLWDGYQQDVLAGAQLDPNRYTVTGGYWAGAPYYENGVMKRDINWTIEAPATSWVAHYYASGETTLYTAVATYSASISDLGLDSSFANESQYELSTDITYRLNEVASSNPIVQMMSANELLMPAIAVVSGVLFLIMLFALIFLARTKTSTWEHGDEAAYNDEDNDGNAGQYDDSYRSPSYYDGYGDGNGNDDFSQQI